MKKNIPYIAWLLCLAFGLAACEKIEPDFYDEGANGAYFDYGYASDFERVLNFSDHIVGHPDTVSLPVKVKLLGYLEEEARTLAIKTKPIEGYALADVTIDEVSFSNNEFEKTIDIKVCRPAEEDSTYAVCIYLDGSGDIGTGIAGKDTINLLVMESYEKPAAVWYSHIETFLGGWSKEKHIFLARHTGNNHFYSALYDADMGMHLYDSIIALNVSAVNALLADDDSIGGMPKDSIDWAVELPILKDSDYPAYIEPYFWNDYEEVLGAFRVAKFCRLTTLLGGSNTCDIAALYASEEGKAKMEEKAADFHKDDVLYMLNEYYRYAPLGYTLATYRDLFWVRLENSANYTVRIPYWWDDPDALGTAAIVKKYFGEYRDDKYQFMLKTMMKDDGEDNFIAASILPFMYDTATGTYTWDPTPIGTKQLAGEERLKECYRIIRDANNLRPASRRHDIPEVDL